MTSSSLAGKHIQFRSLTFHSRLEEQLQECLHLKKFAASLSVAIGALVSPLGPYPERDLVIDLYSGSTPIATMDESDRWINFNRLKKFVTSLSVVIVALGYPLGPYPESDLTIDIYYGSTPTVIMDESDHQISFNLLNKSAISFSTVIGASDSALRLRLERDLAIDLHSDSTPIAIKDKSNRRIRFKRLQEMYNTTIRCDQG
jgi:hypothetical protein